MPASSLRNSHNSAIINGLSETKIYTPFESVSCAILFLDGERIADCNSKALEIFTCNSEEIINQSLGKYLPSRQADGSDAKDKLNHVISTILQGESYFFKWQLTRSNNVIFDAEVSFICLKIEEQRLLYCIVRDVTELNREKDLYKILVRSSLIGIYILRSGKFRFVNSKFQEYVGYSFSELIGMNSLDLVHPDDRKSVRENAIGMLKMQRVNPYEFRTITKDGRVKWIMETVSPVLYDGHREVLGNYLDISDYKQSQDVLKASEERYRRILESFEDGYYEVDLTGKLTFCNQSYCKILGFSQEELMNMDDRPYLDQAAVEKICNVARKVYQTGQPEKYSDYEIIRKDGFKRHIETSLSLARDLSGRPVGFRGVVRDIDDRKKAEATIFHMAYHDALTGLPNRLLFNDRLNVAITHAQRNKNNFAVMMLDLDKFKLINDSFGHDIGDLLLQSVSNRLRGRLRKSDTVARMGGDEFMLLLPEISQEKDAEGIAKKIISSFQRPFLLKNHELKVTASIGIAFYPQGGVDFDMLKKNADIAMYKAKEKGRDNFQSYDSIDK